MFLRLLGLYCSVCFGILIASTHCTCCSHFFWFDPRWDEHEHDDDDDDDDDDVITKHADINS
jgi:hypothetical protein